MEEKTQNELYGEFLIAKAKRLDIPKDEQERIIAMLEYLSKEDRKLYLNKEFQSEFYLQMSNSKLYQVAKNYDSYGTPMQRRSAIMLVKDLPAIYRQYSTTIEESLSQGKRF